MDTSPAAAAEGPRWEERRWRAAGGGGGHQTALLLPPGNSEGGCLVGSIHVLRAGNAQGATSVEDDGICHAALDPRNCGSKKRAATKSYMHGARRRAGVPMSFWREGACQHEVPQTCLASRGIFKHFQTLSFWGRPRHPCRCGALSVGREACRTSFSMRPRMELRILRVRLDVSDHGLGMPSCMTPLQRSLRRAHCQRGTPTIGNEGIKTKQRIA